MKKLCLTLVSLLALSACSAPYSTTEENQYLKSRNGNRLVIPAPLTSANVNAFYVLPDQGGNAKISIKP